MPVNDQTPDVVLYDSNGVELSVSNGVAIPVGTRGLLAVGRDGGNVARILATDSSGNLTISPGTTYPSFTAVYDQIAPATNKYMATLFNTSVTRKVVIQRIYSYNWQFANVADNLLNQQIQRITARTIGTPITPVPDDSADVLSAGITADTNSSAVTVAQLLRRSIRNSAEPEVGSNKDEWLKNARTVDALSSVYEHKDGTRGWTLRQNQGITIQNLSTSTTGSASYVIEFTDEPA